ncbi:MAG: tetratricopeptide repeat protein [Candidatus Eremiobacteraeota bacterium]|nr:tetratricopeptide repeat protein [Candidatus Eremiobacteraeota bacterium]
MESMNGGSPEKWIHEAEALLEQGQVERAVQFIGDSVEKSDDGDKACETAVALLQQYSLWNESLALLEKAARSGGKNHIIWFLKANALDALNPDPPAAKGSPEERSLRESLQCYQKSLEIKKDFPLTWFHKALVEEKLGLIDEAMRSWKAFIDLNPGPELKPQADYARQRLGRARGSALPPAGPPGTESETWLGRLAHGDAQDARAFIDAAERLKAQGVPLEPRPRGKTSLFSIPLEVILLFLSLPVMVPSLLINFITAKRWGRIDFVLLAVDGFIILLFALRSTVATIIILIALAASALLLILRYQKIPCGIFLGYSNLVAMLLMGGGLVFMTGAHMLIPWTALSELTAAMGSEKKVKADQLITRSMGYDSYVTLENDSLEWEWAIYRLVYKDHYEFTRYNPEMGIVISKADELWERREELAGKIVTLAAVRVSPTVIEGSQLEYSFTDKGTKEKDYEKRYFAAVPEANGRVWVLSKPVTSPLDPPLKEFLAQENYRGLLVISFATADMGRWYSSRYGMNLPYMGVAIIPDKSPAVETKKPQRIETWVPVKGTGKTLWLAYRGLATSGTAPRALSGLYKGSMGPINGISELLPDINYFKGPLQKPLVIMAASSRAAYIKENDLAGEFLRGLNWGALLLALPGALVIVGGLFISARE